MTTEDQPQDAAPQIDGVKLRRANVGNIIKKLKAGKTLSATEARAIEAFEEAHAKTGGPIDEIEVDVDTLMHWMCSGKRNIYNMTGIIVKAGPNRFRLLPSLRNRINDLLKNGSGNDADYEADKARKMSADADLAEIEAAKAAGKLIDTRLIRRRWESAVIACRTKLLTIPDRAAPKVIVAPSLEAAKKTLADEISDALESLTEVKHEPDEMEASDDADKA
jgi:phage terminase Nu1 subunit (DNA packaging protein)